ncbi:hypothetical protein STAFG_1094 [Streptomyces afghaniensis 772]|uniref:Glycosyl hydrolase family 98 putative carbohydrate-binding module domain-containing protein n=1 Tax=Streptomyces afghaniensis 772 TaxID=1283301 RepID=S4MXS8_9ACTN|nr:MULTISPECIES: hypothetical protein [Streptomyces]EPJ41856.1 hypothetical protein STAFG_1094 [Streptomyces afghaniensis 772]UOB09543.1 hypothetical protein MQE23_10935 [Streptomyces sp. HP-A2021]
MVDLIEEAPRAVWSSGAGRLVFGGSRNNPQGFAIHPRPGLLLEDGSAHERVLETHPRWTDDGWIRGEFHLPSLASGGRLIAEYGFFRPMGPPQTNGVLIRIGCDGVQLAEVAKRYTGRLDTLSVDLSPFSGCSRTLYVEVDADGDSTQDWLVWTRLAIESRAR